MAVDAASAAAITAQTAAQFVISEKIGGQTTPALPGTLTAIDSDLNLIAYQLMRIADNSKKVLDVLHSIKIATEAQTSVLTDSNTMQAIVVASQVEANDFQRAVTEQALTSSGQEIPKLPPFMTRMKAQVKSALDMVSVARVEGFVNQLFKDSLKNITLYAEGTAIYKTVSAKLEEYKQAVLSVETPSLATVKSKISNLLGLKSAVYYDV
jgi:hypothetical protein